METHGLGMLAASVAALVAGPLLYHLAGRHRAVVAAVHAAVVITILALVGTHILPECVEMGGWVVLVAAGVGLLAPAAVEHRLRAGAGPGHRIALVVGLATLVLHAFTDGIGLLDGHAHAHGHAHSHEAVHGLGLAIVVHRLAEGAALFWLLRPHGARAVVLGVGAVILATVCGFAFGEGAIIALDGLGAGLFQAFVCGVLLHVVLHRHRAQPAVA